MEIVKNVSFPKINAHTGYTDLITFWGLRDIGNLLTNQGRYCITRAWLAVEYLVDILILTNIDNEHV